MPRALWEARVFLGRALNDVCGCGAQPGPPTMSQATRLLLSGEQEWRAGIFTPDDLPVVRGLSLGGTTQ